MQGFMNLLNKQEPAKANQKVASTRERWLRKL
jgi:hypothetical protein